MRFSVELLVEVDDLDLTAYNDQTLFITFKRNGVEHTQSGDKIKVQDFHFEGHQTQAQVRIFNLTPGQGNMEQPI